MPPQFHQELVHAKGARNSARSVVAEDLLKLHTCSTHLTTVLNGFFEGIEQNSCWGKM